MEKLNEVIEQYKDGSITYIEMVSWILERLPRLDPQSISIDIRQEWDGDILKTERMIITNHFDMVVKS